MNAFKVILLGAAAYLGLKGKADDYEQQIKDLSKKVDAGKAEINNWETKYEQLKKDQDGDLKGRLSCLFRAEVWNVKRTPGVYWHYWNSIFYITVKNIGKTPINIRGIRVFWTYKSQTSYLVPWWVGSVTIQPGNSYKFKLLGFLQRLHFADRDSIIEDAIAAEFKEMPLENVEADFLINSNGTIIRQVLKKITGVFKPDWTLYTPYANEWTGTNGSDLAVFNDAATKI